MDKVYMLLEIYLQNYVSSNQSDQAKLLDITRFSYNMKRSKYTGQSPFKIVTWWECWILNTLVATYDRSSMVAYKSTKVLHQQADITQSSLEKTNNNMKKWSDEKRSHEELKVGYHVIVKFCPKQLKSLRYKACCAGYMDTSCSPNVAMYS